MNWNGLELPDKGIYFQDENVIIYCADCREILPSLCGVSAVITDPPYELGFMGKKWDGTGIAFQIDTWRLIMEACLPGSMLLSFGGTRTSHRIACAIEDAGWQIRDTIMWVYSTGFPKSLDISKAIDKRAGKYITGDILPSSRKTHGNMDFQMRQKTAANPQSSEAKLWEGYGTALKPAYEPITLAMKPIDGTFANNALKHKVAGLNIDKCRIGITGGETHKGGFQRKYIGDRVDYSLHGVETDLTPKGRFPANFIHDGSQEVMELFPDTKSGLMKQHIKGGRFNVLGKQYPRDVETIGDSGSAARFFKTCGMTELELLFCRADAIMGIWKQNYVSIATNHSNLSSQHAVSALGHAVIVGSRGDKVLSDVSGLSTSVTPNELNLLAETLIIVTLISVSEHLRGQLQGELIPNGCRVQFVETQKQTDTTTIMISHWKSDGSAELATFSIMPIYLAVGAKDSEFNRFKYTAKASRRERDAGLEDMPKALGIRSNAPRENEEIKTKPSRNNHPTIKPLALMTYLCKLVKMPEYNLILDPFCGSGSTLLACKKLGIKAIGIDSNEEYCELASKRYSQNVMELVV